VTERSEPGAAEPAADTGGSGAASAAAGIAGVERAFLRLTFWQTLLSLVGVFVGAVALYAALTESRAVREQTAAAVWPYLQSMMSDHVGDSEAHFELLFANVGVGPARMQSMLLEVDGEAVHRWQDLVDRFTAAGDAGDAGDEDTPAPEFGRASITYRVIAPGDTLSVFSTVDRDLAAALQSGVYSGRAKLAYCYCSIFDDCWLQDTGSPVARPVSVPACPDYGERAFRE
jgi:hypothetical protein